MAKLLGRGDWHSVSVESALGLSQVDLNHGLTEADAESQLRSVGKNELPARKRRSGLLRFLTQFQNPLIYVLLAAGTITFLLADYLDSAVIFAVVLINAAIGFVQEGRAEKALESVSALLAQQATVLRGQRRLRIDAKHLVPGDLVVLEAGEQVPADLRLMRATAVSVNEAILTGESNTSLKNLEPVPANADLAEQSSMLFSGTIVATGYAVGLVTATAEDTEIGKIGAMLGEQVELKTPLVKRLNQFAAQVTVVILLIGAVAFCYAIFVSGYSLLQGFLAVVGLAVAAIPEGLPAIVTIVLAIGTRSMARHRAIVRRLPAVETLGSVTVICTDKTGTLTRNEMTVAHVYLTDATIVDIGGSGYLPEPMLDLAELDDATRSNLEVLARCATLCNNADFFHEPPQSLQLVGDPTEGALLTLAAKVFPGGAGQPMRQLEKLRAEHPRLSELPFDSEKRWMMTANSTAGGSEVFLKGAPEAVLNLCGTSYGGAGFEPDVIHSAAEGFAGQGMRILALARQVLPNPVEGLDLDALADSDSAPSGGFEFLGLVAVIDPARTEARESIVQCQAAGIKVKMITGDHLSTAVAIGAILGLNVAKPLTGSEISLLDEAQLAKRITETDIVARANPEHKLRLVAALRFNGELVAMTGDGVNDAPALKAADIGVAMGQKGTDAAKQASDLVLTDDNFSTIAAAVRQGRIVYDNIKKALLFALPTNLGEAGVILIAIFFGLSLPVTPAQILWINMVTAVTLALALAFEGAEPGVMVRPPRPTTEPLVTRALFTRLLFVAMLLVLATFAVYEWQVQRGVGIDEARTAAVCMLVVGEAAYLFNSRSFTASAFARSGRQRNPAVPVVLILLALIQLAFVYWAPLQRVFATTPLDLTAWLLIFSIALAIFLVVELEKLLLRRRGVLIF